MQASKPDWNNNWFGSPLRFTYILHFILPQISVDENKKASNFGKFNSNTGAQYQEIDKIALYNMPCGSGHSVRQNVDHSNRRSSIAGSVHRHIVDCDRCNDYLAPLSLEQDTKIKTLIQIVPITTNLVLTVQPQATKEIILISI